MSAARTLHRIVVGALVAATNAAVAEPTDLAAFVALPRPKPSFELTYGSAPAQAVDVFMPRGSGPFPVAILLHGGCWSATTAGREQVRQLGGELAGRGIAVWSIGYRRVNEPGGGYPGTYQDVANAIDRIRSEAAERHLDVNRTVLVGHSAGGHLALWAASRDALPADSALRSPTPFVPRRVISLSGVGDLKAFAPSITTICGPSIAEGLARAPSGGDAYAETSPAMLPSPRTEVLMVSPVLDRLVPPYVAHDYARAVRDKGMTGVEILEISGAGHFDVVTPGTPAWSIVVERIARALDVLPMQR